MSGNDPRSRQPADDHPALPDDLDDLSSEDESRLCALLDGCLHAMQAGQPELAPPIPDDLRQKHPELDSVLRCLDALERFAPGGAKANEYTLYRPLDTEAAGLTDDSDPSGPTMIVESDADGNPLTSLQVNRSAARGSSMIRDLPREFGNYTLQEVIGRGGMGIVYRARHRTLAAPVAIKVIREGELASEDEVRRFYQEARAAGNLQHPNIVRVNDVGECDGIHFLAMELVEGVGLDTLRQPKGIDPQRAAELMLAVSRAVHHLHTRGIIHRDLKPSNILINPEGEPLVTDFGLAKVFGTDTEQTTTGTIIGTPTYMSPEQAWGKPGDVTPQSDVYSLGAILYELIAGRPPLQEENALDLLLQVREAEPFPPSRYNGAVPRDLERICMRCLEKAPAQRYASAADVADDLKRYLQHEPIEAHTISIAQRLRRWTRREPGLVARWLGQFFAATTLQINFWLNDVPPGHHWPIMAVIALWAMLSLGCQKLLGLSTALSRQLPFVWSACDVVLYTVLIILADPPRESLLVGYPLLIVASGLWGRVRLVGMMTVVAISGHLLLFAVGMESHWPKHYPVLVALLLGLCGGFVAYEVYRFRLLTDYFDRRQTPGG